ncbi:MAG TPA: Arc family DNA-binding protein [Geminicoccaceae bacterium]|nr:Arc family DNA-binding protein [Geminicoccaceae bacterium]
MAQILVRRLPDAVAERLKARAKRNNRSLEAEVRAILEESVAKDKAAFLERAAAVRAKLAGRHHTETL